MIKFKTIDFHKDIEGYKKIENEDAKYLTLGYHMTVSTKAFIAILDADLQEIDSLEEYLNLNVKRTFKENLYFASFGYQPKLAIDNFEKFQNAIHHKLSSLLEESNGYFLYNHQVEHFYDFLASYPSPLTNHKLKFRRDLNKKSEMNVYNYLKIEEKDLSKYIREHMLFDFNYYANVKGAYRLAGINI